MPIMTLPKIVEQLGSIGRRPFKRTFDGYGDTLFDQTDKKYHEKKKKKTIRLLKLK